MLMATASWTVAEAKAKLSEVIAAAGAQFRPRQKYELVVAIDPSRVGFVDQL
jgi:hypothetical protein